MSDGEETEGLGHADQLRADIESAIESQHQEPDLAQPPEPGPEPEPTVRGDGRDEKGRFTAKGETGETGETEEAEAPPKPVKEAKVEPAATEAPKDAVRPPPGFSVASKTIWDTLPQSVRDDIAKREQEVDNGFKRYGGLGRYAEEAERNGTTLQNAVNDYVSVENALKQNFVGGVEFLCRRMGVDPRALAQRFAERYAPRTAPAAQQQVQALQQPVIDPNAIAQHVASVIRAEAEQEKAISSVEAFKADPKNIYFENLRQDMAILVQTGKATTIQDAYEAARWLHPEIRGILINEANGGKNKEAATAVSRSRSAAKAVGGSPAPGVNPDASSKRKNMSLDEEIRAAVDAQIGGI
jgi:hypothetical protein